LPITDSYVKATDIQKIKGKDGSVLRVYDPGYMNTISCTSRISYIDGDIGILEYRGYPIEQLAEKSNFLEVAFLLIYGELPTPGQYSVWCSKIMSHTFVHTDVQAMMKSFRYDAHPMGMLVSTISAISTLHPEANPALAGQKIYDDKKIQNKQIFRIIGILPTLCANAYRHRIGRNYNLPSMGLGYVENFLYMMDHLNEKSYQPHPRLVRALEILFILHAEHELNCSTAAVRHLASSGVDVYTCIAGAAAALYGPKHGVTSRFSSFLNGLFTLEAGSQ
jgi:citrate synthase